MGYILTWNVNTCYIFVNPRNFLFLFFFSISTSLFPLLPLSSFSCENLFFNFSSIDFFFLLLLLIFLIHLFPFFSRFSKVFWYVLLNQYSGWNQICLLYYMQKFVFHVLQLLPLNQKIIKRWFFQHTALHGSELY